MKLSLFVGIFVAIITAAIGQDNVYDCHRLPGSCLNGGTCGDSPDCKCADGFTDYNCQRPTAAALCSDQSITDPCMDNGICYISEATGSSVAVCACKYGYFGDNCEEKIVNIDCQGNTAEYTLSFPSSDFGGRVILVDENGTSLEDTCPLTNTTQSDRKEFSLMVDLTEEASNKNVSCKMANIFVFNEGQDTYQAKLRVYYWSDLMTNLDQDFTLNCTHNVNNITVSSDITSVEITEDLDQVEDEENFNAVELSVVDNANEDLGDTIVLGETTKLVLYPSVNSGYEDVLFETCKANNTLEGDDTMELVFLDQSCTTVKGQIIYATQEGITKNVTVDGKNVTVQGKVTKFRTFKFANSNTIGVVCTAKVCKTADECAIPTNCQGGDDEDDQGTTEAPENQDRRKRSAEDQNEEKTVSKVFTVVGKKEQINDKTSEQEQDGQDPVEKCLAQTEITAVVAILGAVVCVLLVVCFVFACIIMRRKGKHTTTYDPAMFQPNPERFQIPRAHVNESYEIM